MTLREHSYTLHFRVTSCGHIFRRRETVIFKSGTTRVTVAGMCLQCADSWEVTAILNRGGISEAFLALTQVTNTKGQLHSSPQ